jgi:hypothetical protein
MTKGATHGGRIKFLQLRLRRQGDFGVPEWNPLFESGRYSIPYGEFKNIFVGAF